MSQKVPNCAKKSLMDLLYVKKRHELYDIVGHLGQNQFLIPVAKYVPAKKLFCSMNRDKIRGKRFF